jgi:hypothetical protein
MDEIDYRIFQRTRPSLTDGDAIYVTGEECLRVTSFNGLAGVILAIEGRVTRVDGVVVPFVETHTPNTNRTALSTLITLPEGFLGNVQVRASTGAPGQGQCFVLVELVRGRLQALQPLGTLIGGYVTDVQRRVWPGALVGSSIDGRGFLRSFTGTDPAAGVEISETVPTGARWRLVSMSFTFTTDATVANRFPVITLDDGALVYCSSSVGAAVTATQAARISAGAFGTVNTATVTGFLIPLPPDVILPAGHRIRTATVSFQAGDNYAAPQLLVEEWIAG